MSDSDMYVIIQACLAQNGNPIAFSSAGGGSLRFDFDDSQIPGAAALLALRDVMLEVTIKPMPGVDPFQRRGGARVGAGRKPKTEPDELASEPDEDGQPDPRFTERSHGDGSIDSMLAAQ